MISDIQITGVSSKGDENNLKRFFRDKGEIQGGRWISGWSNQCFIFPDNRGQSEKRGKEE